MPASRKHRDVWRPWLVVLVVACALAGASPKGLAAGQASDFDFQFDSARLAAYGMKPDHVVRQIERALERLPKDVSDEEFLAAARKIQLLTPSGKRVPLSEVASIVPKSKSERKPATDKPPEGGKAAPKGKVEKKISLQLDRAKLNQFKLTAQEVSRQVKAQIKALTADELSKVLITTDDGKKVPLTSIATIEEVPVDDKGEPKSAPGPSSSQPPKPFAVDKLVGKLELRVVPNMPGSDREPELSEPDIKAMIERLSKGQADIRADDAYMWAELHCKSDGFVVADFRDMKLGLLCNAPSRVLLPGKSDQTAWGLEKAFVVMDQFDQYCVSVRFDSAGMKRFAQLTRSNLNNRLAVLVDGKVLCAPILKSALSRDAIISGNFTRQEAEKLAEALNKTMGAKRAGETSDK